MARGKRRKSWKARSNDSVVPVPEPLPEELVMEIMVRLPGKDLTRLKCLSKFWYKFIGSNYFTQKHFQHHNNLPPRLLVHDHQHHDRNRLGLTVFPNAETLAPDTHHPIKFPYPPCFPNHLKGGIIGPVNGLFLLRCSPYDYPAHQKPHNYYAAIFNPATGQFIKLTAPFKIWPSSSLGLGFDSTTNDFKVISFKVSASLNPLRVSVYSLADKSWRYLDYFFGELKWPSLEYECGGMYFNHGAFYWLFYDDDSTLSLLSFDMRNDAIAMIDGPDYNPLSKGPSFCRGYKNDNLLAIFLFPKDVTEHDSVDVMVRKNDGCWEKHLSIDTSFVGEEISFPLGLWKDNQLLFDQSPKNQLCLYDPHTNEIKEFGIFDNSSKTEELQIFYYKENLISFS